MAEKSRYFDAYSGTTLDIAPEMVTKLEAGLADRAQIYRAIARINRETLTGILNVTRRLPDRLTGRLLAPGARPGARLRLKVPRPAGHSGLWVVPSTVTDAGGAFDIDLPPADLPADGVQIRVEGGEGRSATLAIPRADLIGSGDLGVLALPGALPPLPMSAYGTLASYAPNSPRDVDEEPDAWADLQPGIMLGEGDCAARIDPDGKAFDRFSYGMLFRMVDPELWPKVLTLRWGRQGLRKISMRQIAQLPPQLRRTFLELGEVSFDEREPITQPVSVDGYARSISTAPLDYPKAGTLGLGYVLGMRQSWEPTGFSLGDLIYSLPLAPGEVQRLAVRERRETLSAYDRESLSVSERRAFDEAVDSSASSVFSSALTESGSGGTSWEEKSDAGNVGAGFSLLGMSFGGGSGWSGASGSTDGWSSASRSFVSSAMEQFNGTVSRQSATARQAARTSMRLATSSDRSETTTRVIANHNRLHALTVQYWEVLRHFSVTSRPDDVTLVAFVPLQLIRWRPAGAPLRLDYDVNSAPSEQALRRRYGMIWRYADRIWSRLPRRSHVKGMRQLRRLMTTPDIDVVVALGMHQVSLDISLKGSFLPFDEVSVDAIDRAGRRIGRVQLSPGGATPDFGAAIDRDALIGKLREHRAGTGNSHTRSGVMLLRRGVDLSRVERFDIRTRMTSHTHVPDPDKINTPFVDFTLSVTVEDISNFERDGDFWKQFTVQPFTLSAGELRREVGGPKLTRATISDAAANAPQNDNLVEPSKVLQGTLPPWLPLPARPVTPVLTDEQLVEIERLFQHVVTNPMRYSKAVWSGLDADERALMLEAYTIGVPPDSDATADASQEIPLLNCVTNRLLGFFGNSMILPFHLPPELERAAEDGVAGERAVTTRDIQEALLQFHREGFRPSKLSVTLPTNGQLGEAVLGHCASGEKIDHTRFWNWQDGAPDEVRAVSLPQQAGSELIGEAGAGTPAVTPGLLAPQIAGGFIPENPQAPQPILEAALKAAIPWLQTKLEDVRGMEALTELMAAALGRGDKPGVDVAAVNALNKAISESAAAKGLKLGDLTGRINEKATKQTEENAANKASEEKKKTDAAAAVEKAEAARQAKLTSLITSAAKFAALLQATPAAGRADAATAIVTELVGPDTGILTSGEKASLYDAYAPATGDAASNEDGKAAMRTALSLP